MIKIHAGLFKGRNIKRPNISSTKETASMVREAVFNSLFSINGKVLDLFAGSGSYGITAYSLGASLVYFVDTNFKAVSTVKENLRNLGLEELVYKMNYLDFLKSNVIIFDYIFLDPPYDFNNYEKLLNDCVIHLNNSGKIILELDKKTKLLPNINNLTLIRNKTYGSKRVLIYEKSISN